MDNPSEVHQWLQAENPPQFFGMGFIMADLGNGHLEPIGTGFITQARDTNALFVTAAHNVEWILQHQNANPRTHRTTLPEFAPAPPALNLDPKKVRVSCVAGDRVEVAVVSGVIYDTRLDFAVLQVKLQEGSKEPFFQYELLFDDTVPKAGEEIGLMGYAGMEVVEKNVHGPQSFEMKIQVVRTLRRGRVVAHYEKGQRLCKGPCVETTIPVYPGMSGGPVFRIPAREGDPWEILGLICCDPFASENERLDTTIAGSSLAALLPVNIVERLPDGKRRCLLRLPEAIGVGTFVDQRMEWVPKV